MGILADVSTTDRDRVRFERQQHLRQHLEVVADRLVTADRERTAAIAVAHRQGLSVRQIATAVRLSSARVHQLLHAPVLETSVLVAAMRESVPTGAMTESRAPVRPPRLFCANAPTGLNASSAVNP